ncbi:MAG: (2Fe-2S)-binding protein [Myxococcota bacterium]|jgi:bacterioferritin-associated ferredoxin|nr:(2Fe-2S)-binding protein [Myxococcota bacterium]
MIVCLCEGLTDRDLQCAIEQGADTVDRLKSSCGAGEGCGSCSQTLMELIDTTCTDRIQAARDEE